MAQKKLSSYYLSIILPALVIMGLLTSNALASFMILMFVFFVLFPVIDALSGQDKLHSYAEMCAQKNTSFPSAMNSNLLPLYLVVLLQIVMVVIALYKVSHEGVQWFPYIILMAYVSISGLVAAHELYHTQRPFQTFVARSAAILALWNHEEVPHLHVHHRDELACLPNDISLAHMGESVYAYIWRMVIGNSKATWQIQNELLKKNNQKLISINNHVLIETFLSILLVIFVALIFGKLAFIFFIGYAITTIFAWGIGIYPQHYGLGRRKKADGTYEDFTYMNVWNGNSRFGNRLWFNIFKHSAHHMFIFCPYTELKLIDNSPVFPMSIHRMLLTTLIPPLWYKIMDKEVDKILKRRDELETKGML